MGVVVWRTTWALALAAFALPATAQRLNIIAANVTAPATAVEGGTISVSATFESASTAQPASFRWSVYLTQNGVIDGATFLGRFGPLALNAIDTRTVTEQINLPDDVSGRFTIAVVADVNNNVAEFDELDNTTAAANVTRIREEAADPAIVAVSTRELRAREGEAVRVLFTVENFGELPSTVTVGAYLSPDPTLASTDVLLGAADVTVPAGARIDGSVDAVVPTVFLAGDYTIGAIADVAGAIDEVDELNNSRAAVRPFNIFRDALSIVSDSLPEGTRGIAYHALVEARDGDGHYFYSVTDGRLPAGLVIGAMTGVISGTPTESGEHRFTVNVTSNNLSDSRPYTILIDGTGEPLTVVSLTLGNGSLGLTYAQNLIAAGGEPPYRWTLENGALPPGLDLRTDGIISGVPSVLGEFEFEVAVTDRLGARDEAIYTVSVAPPVTLLILDTDLPELPVGVAVHHALNVTGGVPPYHWQALSSPPPGLTITENGRLSGTPTQVGRFQVLVRAEDSTRAGAFDSRLIQVTVADDGALAIETHNLPVARLRGRYQQELTATGGTPPLTWSIVPGDSPPSGFFLVQGDGTDFPADSAVLKGLGLRADVHPFAVQVEDAYGRKSTKLFTLEVLGFDATSDGGCVCVRPSTDRSGVFALLSLFIGLLLARPTKRSRD